MLFKIKTSAPSGNSSLTPRDMGLQQYRDNILGVHEIRHQLLHDLLHEVARERQGESIDRPLMKNLLRMLTSVNLYRGSFEPRFLERTTEFYTAESSRRLDEVEVGSNLTSSSRNTCATWSGDWLKSPSVSTCTWITEPRRS